MYTNRSSPLSNINSSDFIDLLCNNKIEVNNKLELLTRYNSWSIHILSKHIFRHFLTPSIFVKVNTFQKVSFVYNFTRYLSKLSDESVNKRDFLKINKLQA